MLLTLESGTALCRTYRVPLGLSRLAGVLLGQYHMTPLRLAFYRSRAEPVYRSALCPRGYPRALWGVSFALQFATREKRLGKSSWSGQS